MRRRSIIGLILSLVLCLAGLAQHQWRFAGKAQDRSDRSDRSDRREPSYAAKQPEGEASAEDTVLKNLGYTVGYNETLRNPRWVRYELDWNRRSPKKWKRPKVPFSTDPRTRAQVRTEDFTRSGFSRGHMAPSFAIGAFHGKDAQLETFLLSNIVPQNQKCNDGVWNSIERMEADDFAKRFKKIIVVDGPVFEKQPPDRLRSGIAVPTGFFKFIKRPDGQTIAFLVPQHPNSPKPENYLTSPEKIEALTGISFDLSPEEAGRTRTKIW